MSGKFFVSLQLKWLAFVVFGRNFYGIAARLSFLLLLEDKYNPFPTMFEQTSETPGKSGEIKLKLILNAGANFCGSLGGKFSGSKKAIFV